MAYATYANVKERLGRFDAVFEVAGKKPDQATLDAILGEVSADIDSAIRAHGFDPATLTQGAKDALVDLAAYGALARALPSTNLGPQGAELLATARSIWDLGLASITDGTNLVIVELEAGAGGGTGPSAGDLWSEQPTYGSRLGLESEGDRLVDTNLAPAFRRGMHL